MTHVTHLLGYAIGGAIAGLLASAVGFVSYLFERDPWGERRWRREPLTRWASRR